MAFNELPFAESNKAYRVVLINGLTGEPIDFDNLGIKGSGEPFNDYGADTAVPFNLETTLLSKTVSLGKEFRIQGFSGNGSAVGCFLLKINGSQVGRLDNSGSNKSMTTNFGHGTIKAEAGDIVTITVKHKESTNQSFQANLFGNEITL